MIAAKKALLALFVTTFLIAFTACQKNKTADSSASRSPDLTTVKTVSGEVRGVANNDVISWKGIPYAAPPVGKLRWRAPQPVTAWSGTRDATQFGPACMQADDVLKSEDCLFLNIWRPVSGNGPFPVMVWIHGGVLLHGSSTLYPGEALAKKGVVVVSLNYRLGRLGFFAHPALAAESPSDIRGNYGYLDQLAALQWVQHNIAAFGGDPKQVTIFGESAGGGSVLVLLVSPMSRGLFVRAIAESPGTPNGRAGVIPSSSLSLSEKIATEWARSIGIEGSDAAALEKLRALAPERLVEGVSSKEGLAALSAGKNPSGMPMSIIDGRLLPETVEAAVRAGHQAQIPFIIGANDRDIPLGTAGSKNQLFAIFGPDAAVAKKLYDPHDDQTLDELKQQVFADRTMTEPARNIANLLARTDQPVYLYRFAYVNEAVRDKLKGTQHGFEIPFVFNIPGALVGGKATSADKVMGELTSSYWAQFGKTGDPNGGGRPNWPRYDPAVDRIFLFQSSGAAAGPDPIKPRLDLWQRVWERNK